MIENKKMLAIWHNIINRCGNSKYPTYMNCSVCEEWLDYSNFKNWYNLNYYTVNNEKMCVDKDILFKNNKIYSPDTCCIVPETINMILTNRIRYRGNLPVGVTLTRNKKYMSKCKVDKKDHYLGTFNTPNEAFEAYKKFKENYIKDVANKYKNLIPNQVYESLMNYEVEIDD